MFTRHSCTVPGQCFSMELCPELYPEVLLWPGHLSQLDILRGDLIDLTQRNYNVFLTLIEMSPDYGSSCIMWWQEAGGDILCFSQGTQD